MLTAIVGINWGDEGKGRIVDLLSCDYDVVARYQGGNNAGHTVINERGKFILNLIPSGILRENVVCVMGPGMVIDPAHLYKEIANLREQNIAITHANLKISDRAVITMPYHVALDKLEENRLGKNSYGSTQRGIAPAYGDKYLKKALRMGDLLDYEGLCEKLPALLEYKNLTMHSVYGASDIDIAETLDTLKAYADEFAPYICDTGDFLCDAYKAGKNIMFEAQLGALRDIDYGIYPFTSSSTTLAAYAPVGAGAPGLKLTKTVGIMKAYSSCVGAGPFTCELFGKDGEELRTAGGEYGAATGRPRRVGGFDVVASRYGIRVQGADEIALTKLDVLSYLEKIPVCIAYDVDGERTERFPIGAALERAKPVYEYLDGWKTDISGCRSFNELPENARAYIKYIAQSTGANITLVSVGAERDAYFTM